MAIQLSDWPQSVQRVIVAKAYLSSDHISAATSKTIAVQIRTTGGGFGNPSGGVTNMTEIANGWYYLTLTTTDMGTVGAIIVRGTSSGVDDVECFFDVVDANKAHLAYLDATISGVMTSGAMPANFTALSIDASGNVKVQGPLKKNTALSGFPFPMFDVTNHALQSGISFVAGDAKVSLNGGAFVNTTNTPTAISNGMYKVDLAAADLNANTVQFRVAKSGSDDTEITIVTTP